MFAILKREVQNYFLTPIGYIFMGIFLLISGIFFTINNIFGGSADMSVVFSNMNWPMMLGIPILTMKLLSEEKRNKSDQLLLTSPRSIWDIVLGKTLAACAVMLATMVVALLYVVIVTVYSTEVQPGLIISNFLGTFLLGCCYVAIGVLMSTVTESQVIAVVLAMGVNVVLWIIEMIAPQLSLPAAISFLSTVFSWMSLYTRYYEFQTGLLSIANVVYYLSFCGIFLFMAVRIIDKRRWSEG